MIKVAIAGGTGYTAGELIRLLINHPEAEILSVQSNSSAGESISSVHRDLLGETDLKFSGSRKFPESMPIADILFLCLGHGLSRKFIDENHVPQKCKVVDLGNDFRLENHYGNMDFVYGLSEFCKEEVKSARCISNPGCFATAILLGLSPLAKKGFLFDDIHIHAITGSTGAGKSPSESTHFSYRSSNISVYKPFTHQHLGEIEKTLSSITGSKVPVINFVPMRGDFARGIFASIYTKCKDDMSVDQMRRYFQSVYEDSPFVFVSDESISLKEVVNTNKALIHIDKHNGYWHITTVIDNLLKGASGQAVQNMNLMFSLDESCGLHLKGSAF